jgi:TPR repeat protein
VETQVALGRLLYAGLTGTPNVAAAHTWFAQAADAGHAFAQAWMGDCCRMGLLDAPHAESAEAWYRKAAAQNHIGAVLVLANALRAAGPSTPEALAEIFGLWLVAASGGHPVAQRNVAQCYLYGRGCIADPAAATRWFQAAAEQGDAEAEYQLARCYRKGYGVQKDPQTARFWLERASAQGHPQALLGTL